MPVFRKGSVLPALGEFLSHAVRPRGRIARAIVPVLAIKVCLILLAKFTVFGGDNRIEVTPDMVDQKLGVVLRTSDKES